MGKKITHDTRLKSRVALEAIKGESTIAEIANKYQIHQSLVSKWKLLALEGLPGVFSGKIKSPAKQQEAETKRLYEQIGKLQVKVDFLKNAVYQH